MTSEEKNQARAAKYVFIKKIKMINVFYEIYFFLGYRK